MLNFNIQMYLYRGIAVLLSLGVHEMAHALVSYWLGDTTAKAEGRLTLNPFSHIDIVGLACMLFFGIGWAKPVPIDPRYYKDRKTGIVWTSFAGPMANFILSFICVFLFYASYRFVYSIGTLGVVIQNILSYTAMISASIGVFNLIPIPPMDGSKVLFAFLPDEIYYKAIQENRIWSIVLLVLIFSRLITGPISMLTGNLVKIFTNISLFIL